MSTPSTPVAAVDRLVDAGIVAAADRERALEVLGATSTAPATAGLPRRLGEIAAYVGGVLVLVAATMYTTLRWDELSPADRLVLVATGAGVLALAGVATVAVARGPRRVRRPEADVGRRLAGTLLVGAGALTGAAVRLGVDDLLGSDDLGPSRAGWAAAAAVLVGAYVLAPTVLGIGCAGIAVVGLAVALAETQDGRSGWVDEVLFSCLVLVAAAVLLGLVEAADVVPTPQAGRVVLCAMTFVAAQALAGDGHLARGYVALGVLAVVAFAAYAVLQAWPYLALGVLSATVGVTEAAHDLGGDSLGAVGALLVAGGALLLTSLVGGMIRASRDPSPAAPSGRH